MCCNWQHVWPSENKASSLRCFPLVSSPLWLEGWSLCVISVHSDSCQNWNSLCCSGAIFACLQPVKRWKLAFWTILSKNVLWFIKGCKWVSMLSIYDAIWWCSSSVVILINFAQVLFTLSPNHLLKLGAFISLFQSLILNLQITCLWTVAKISHLEMTTKF